MLYSYKNPINFFILINTYLSISEVFSCESNKLIKYDKIMKGFLDKRYILSQN
jgi:hypothetical protein